MTKREHMKYWFKSAKHDLKVAQDMLKNKHYDWCLFLGHLVLEKVLKAFWVRDNRNSVPPKIHSLTKLLKQTKLKIDEEQTDFLIIIDKFYIAGRYPDYRFKFYKLCTRKYAEEKFKKIKELYKWLIKKIK